MRLLNLLTHVSRQYLGHTGMIHLISTVLNRTQFPSIIQYTIVFKSN